MAEEARPYRYTRPEARPPGVSPLAPYTTDGTVDIAAALEAGVSRRELVSAGIRAKSVGVAQKLLRDTVRLDTGERVDAKAYESLPPERQIQLKQLGITGFNREQSQRQARFEAAHVELSTGEWVSRADYDSLTSEQQASLSGLGISKFNEAQAQVVAQQLQSQLRKPVGLPVMAPPEGYTIIGSGEYVPVEQYNALSFEDKQRLNMLGTVRFNAEQEAKYQESLTAEREFYEEHPELVAGLPTEPVSFTEQERAFYEEHPELVAGLPIEPVLREGMVAPATAALDLTAQNLVRLGDGQHISLENWQGLTSEQRGIGAAEGLEALNREIERGFYEEHPEMVAGLPTKPAPVPTAPVTFAPETYDSVRLGDGSHISLADWQRLTPDQRQVGVTHGLDALNQELEVAGIAATTGLVRLGDGRYIEQETWQSLTPDQRRVGAEWGLAALNRELEVARVAATTEGLVRVKDDYISLESWQALTPEQRGEMSTVGVKEFNIRQEHRFYEEHPELVAGAPAEPVSVAEMRRRQVLQDAAARVVAASMPLPSELAGVSKDEIRRQASVNILENFNKQAEAAGIDTSQPFWFVEEEARRLGIAVPANIAELRSIAERPMKLTGKEMRERSKALALAVAEIVVPGLFLGRHWTELSAWEKVLWVSLDAATLAVPFLRGAKVMGLPKAVVSELTALEVRSGVKGLAGSAVKAAEAADMLGRTRAKAANKALSTLSTEQFVLKQVPESLRPTKVITVPSLSMRPEVQQAMRLEKMVQSDKSFQRALSKYNSSKTRFENLLLTAEERAGVKVWPTPDPSLQKAFPGMDLPELDTYLFKFSATDAPGGSTSDAIDRFLKLQAISKRVSERAGVALMEQLAPAKPKFSLVLEPKVAGAKVPKVSIELDPSAAKLADSVVNQVIRATDTSIARLAAAEALLSAARAVSLELVGSPALQDALELAAAKVEASAIADRLYADALAYGPLPGMVTVAVSDVLSVPVSDVIPADVQGDALAQSLRTTGVVTEDNVENVVSQIREVAAEPGMETVAPTLSSLADSLEGVEAIAPVPAKVTVSVPAGVIAPDVITPEAVVPEVITPLGVISPLEVPGVAGVSVAAVPGIVPSELAIGAVEVVPAVGVQARVAPKVEAVTRTVTGVRIPTRVGERIPAIRRPTRARLPLPISARGVGDRVRVPVGSIAWKMGAFWKYIPPPWNENKPRTLRYPPQGARDTGSNRPQDTLQVIGKRPATVPKEFSIDLGVTDVFITDYGRKITFSGHGRRTNVGTRIDSPTRGMSVGGGLDANFRDELELEGAGRPLADVKKPRRKKRRLTDWEYTTTLKGFRP